MTASLRDRVRARLEGLEQSGLLRTLKPPAGIDLSSNDYLGLANHPRVKAAMAAAIAREGVGSTGSRLLRGERGRFAALEERFARFKGTERSLYFSSGYLANLAVLTTFAEGDDVIVSDERNHASLIDGIRLSPARREIVAHNDVGAVRRALRAEAGEAGRTGRASGASRWRRARDAGESSERFLVVESLFSMDGDEAPLVAYAAACAATGAHLIVDEAHAVGVYGERGTGLIEAHGITDRVFLSINTAGKALGVSGAFVAGPAWAIDYLIQRARPFIFSTAPPPALAAALDASLDVIEGEPQRRALLRATVEKLRARLAAAGVPAGTGSSHIIPIFIGDNAAALEAAEALQAAGFDVRAIRPPSVPPGTARLRISVNVNLTDDLIDRFVPALASALTGVGAGL
ncbi:MAG TPA: 8-amino-7-oxononanoate synthase [Vicinamibacterales bacterium]|jgi:8-amino-7-oxononanoate synthase